MVYRASRETRSISALRFASTCFPSKDPTPALRGSPRVPQGLPHRLRALQDTPLANTPPGPRTTSSRANRMSWRLPATVGRLLYLSLISLSPHPVFSRLAEPTTTSLLPALTTLATLPTHEHTHRDTTTLPVLPLATPSEATTHPHTSPHTHSRIESLMHSQSDTRRYISQAP